MSRVIKFDPHRILALVAFLFSGSLSAANYNGDWFDNGSGLKRIGDLTVSDKAITIKKFSTYSVALDSKDGDVNIYKVLKANTKKDPLGCGPDSKVNYIIIHSLPSITGLEERAIRLIFYGRSTAPKMKGINDDPGVCAVYSFGINP